MTIFCIILVLISAGMHASWNLICKSKSPSGAFFLIATTTSLIALAPVTIYLLPMWKEIPSSVWWMLAATGTVQSLYYIGLGNAYRVCEVSLAYPLARALPVLFVPVVMLALSLGGTITLMAIFGMVLVACGCITLPMTFNVKVMLKEIFSKGYLFILLAALGTTGYTIIDSEALRLLTETSNVFTHGKTVLLYIGLENLCIEVLLLIYVISHREERHTFKKLIHDRAWQPMLSGVICTASYTIILLAMMFATNVSYIAAFRQVSIPLGAILGILIFKEKASYAKLIGILLIFAGLVMVALY
jgi:drug/metabolite transporter (DMT)-like permease